MYTNSKINNPYFVLKQSAAKGKGVFKLLLTFENVQQVFKTLIQMLLKQVFLSL